MKDITGTLPVVTAETFVIPLDGDSSIVYAPLRRAAFVANRHLVNFLAALSSGEWRRDVDPEDHAIEFLRGLEILDSGPETVPDLPSNKVLPPTLVTLFLTNACNLRCVYCYATAGELKRETMDLATAQAAIQFVAQNAYHRGEKLFEVAYHGGGEPTQNWDVLIGSFRYAQLLAKDLGLTVRGTCATNGVLGRPQVDWIIANLAGASVSCDGLPEVQDANRPTVAGRGTSKILLQTLRRFDEAGFPYGLRLTVLPNQIDQLADSVEFLCQATAVQRIQAEPVYRMGRWESRSAAESGDFVAGFREAKKRAQRHGRELFFSAARVDSLSGHFCHATTDLFAVTPRGSVSACFEVYSEGCNLASEFLYGNLSAKGELCFDITRQSRLRELTVHNIDYCRGCFARWHCAGDCPNKRLAQKDTSGSERCDITRELCKDILLERIRDSGGLFWHPDPRQERHIAVGED